MCLRAVTRLLLSVIVVQAMCQVALRAQQVTEGDEAAQQVTESDEAAQPAGIADIDLGTWQQAYNENQKLLVLLYKQADCERCPAALDSLTKILGQQELPQGLTIAKSFSPELVSKIGTDQFPSLAYLRDKSHVIYDGNFEVADIIQWILVASNKVIQRLDDDSFDGAISAAPGVNTEDWLLVFYKEACKNAVSVVESFGVTVYGRIKVAKINSHDSPRLTHRFKVANCPELVFIKHGKVYKYQLPVVDVASLTNFVDNSYSNFEGEDIPNVEDDVDFLSGSLPDFIKVHLRGDNQPVIVASLCSVVVGVLFIIFCCCRPKASRRSKKAKKE